MIAKAAHIEADFKERKISMQGKDFAFEHIVSGAMLTSVRQRAIRHAFARDKKVGKARGVMPGDVIQAVTDIWDENKSLEHGWARDEFMSTWAKELEDAKTADKRKGMN